METVHLFNCTQGGYGDSRIVLSIKRNTMCKYNMYTFVDEKEFTYAYRYSLHLLCYLLVI